MNKYSKDKYSILKISLYNKLDFKFNLDTLTTEIPFDFVPQGVCGVLGDKFLKLQ